jgi:intraflagellar transport protein 88
MTNLSQALEWYSVLVSVTPTDPKVLAKLGELSDRDGDKPQAFHYYSESYRFNPCDLDVVAWLGSYHVECETYEQAMRFFDKATKVDPSEIKWPLMAASCLRRCGNYQQAFDAYKRIHEKWPNNVECLRFIVRIASDIGSKEVTEWQALLAKLESKSPAELPAPSNYEEPRDSLPRSNSIPLSRGEDPFGRGSGNGLCAYKPSLVIHSLDVC